MEQSAVLEYFRQVMPYLSELYGGRKIGFAVTDREKYIYYKAWILDLTGQPLKQGTAVVRAMDEKRRIVFRGDKALFGVPYIAAACPIFDGAGGVVGALVLLESVQQQDELKDMAATLDNSISVLASTTEEISAQAEEIAALCGHLTGIAQQSQTTVKETDHVLGLIKSITDQTNLLGLNAAIEAARVGDMGRGFGVVADEIRKLSYNSAESIKKIGGILQTIQVNSDSTFLQANQLNEVISQVVAAITHVAGAVQQAGALARKLDLMAEDLVKEG